MRKWGFWYIDVSGLEGNETYSQGLQEIIQLHAIPHSLGNHAHIS